MAGELFTDMTDEDLRGICRRELRTRAHIERKMEEHPDVADKLGVQVFWHMLFVPMCRSELRRRGKKPPKAWPEYRVVEAENQAEVERAKRERSCR